MKNLASGVYYYKIVVGEFQDMRKIILLRERDSSYTAS